MASASDSVRMGEVLLDQVGDDLGVCLGGELVTLTLELRAQLDVVLDDAVQDDVNAAGAVRVRVGVALGRTAVRGPARVPDAGGRFLDQRRDIAVVSCRCCRCRCPLASTAARSLLRLPTARTDSISPSSSSDRPAES